MDMSDNQEQKIDKKKLFTNLSRVVLGMLPFVAGPELYDLITDLSRSRTGLNQKIVRAQASLTETSELIDELQGGLAERIASLNHLQEEYDKYSKLAEVEEDKAHAIVQQIDLAIGRRKGRELLITLALNLLAGVIIFILGIVFGPSLIQWLGIGQ